MSGLVSTNKGSFKEAISDAIRDLGYEVFFTVLDASNYGVPQIRKRVFFIGVPKGAKWLFPYPTHGKNFEKINTVADAILGDLPPLESNEESNRYLTGAKTRLQKYLRKKKRTLINHKAPNHPQGTIKRISQTVPGHPMYKKFSQRIRLDSCKPSPTQICGGIRPQFQFGHPTQSRGLSIRERARIQSFPDSYEFSGGLTQGRVQTGNAVPPIVAKALGDQLLSLLSGNKIDGFEGEPHQVSLFD